MKQSTKWFFLKRTRLSYDEEENTNIQVTYKRPRSSCEDEAKDLL
jgi:hypothetical protein